MKLNVNFTGPLGGDTILFNMSGKKLLVADDSLTIQKVIRLALSNEGYEIQAVSDGNDAIQQIALFRPDVVLIDISLPGRSAFEVKRETNSHPDLAAIRFVLMSSAFEKVDEIQSSEVIFQGQLTKPFDPAHLRKVLMDVITAGSVFSQNDLISLGSPIEMLPPLPFSDNQPPAFEFQNDMPPPLPREEPTLEFVSPLEVSAAEWSMPLQPEIPIDLPPPLPPEQPPRVDDIQQLTESTLHPTNLEDFQWSVNEPSIQPLPEMRDRGGSNFDFGAQPPPPPISPPPAPLAMNPELLPPPPIESLLSENISQPQLEKLVQQQVQQALEKMTQKLLPDIAERIIKEEIHRLLSE